MAEQKIGAFKVRGKTIREDDKGRISLNDIHSAAGFEKNRKPNDWIRLPTTSRLIEAVLTRITGKSRNWAKSEITSVYYAAAGATGGTFADPRLALAYAEYLNPKLAVEVREVFLRYKAGDATLADETLQRSTPEGNEWAVRRALGRVIRNEYTEQLKSRGIEAGFQYGNCTNETYKGLFDKTAKELKKDRGLPASGALRDKMSMAELAFVAASEALSVEHMVEVDAAGYGQCRKVTAGASHAIRSAIEADRRSRQSRLV